MNDLERMIAAEREFKQENQGNWDLDEFNKWLAKRYRQDYRVVDSGCYV